jgi:plasmid stability protein
MPERNFATITVSDAVYAELKRRAKRESKSTAAYASELLRAMLFVERFSKCNSSLTLIAVSGDGVVVRDGRKDRIVGVRDKQDGEGKLRFYCELDDTDYCEHTAFAEAIPQIRKGIRG